MTGETTARNEVRKEAIYRLQSHEIDQSDCRSVQKITTHTSIILFTRYSPTRRLRLEYC